MLSSVPTTPSSETTSPRNSTATPPFSDCPHCLNGGTYVGGYCQCLPGYSGVYCEMAKYPPGTYVMNQMCMFACIGVLVSKVYSLPPPLTPLLSPSPLFSPLPHPLSPLSSLIPLPLTLPPHPTLPPVHTCPTDLAYPCGECYNGTCDYASATCVCHPLYEGERCDRLTSE